MDSAQHQDDRRKSPRMASLIRVEPLDGSAPMAARDISLGGMLAIAMVPRWPGSLVAVRFHLPGTERAIRATCRVHNLVDVPHGIGLALTFLKLAPEAQMGIHHFVDSRPLPPAADWDERLESWLVRMVEDCKQLVALASP